MNRKTIKRRLRELAADPGQPGAAAEVQRLKGALRRLSRSEAPPRLAAGAPAPADPEADAVATWPPELRARLQHASFGRVIDGRTLDDPGGWGALNDLRRSR
ncbi:hypothetical protein [Streptomyces sp. NBC_01092]|uniref:hypothetical protein n=1 Tax=Streptomyces sp. NBC_01092 TaxID=2903748 RepID=UPI00386972D1|nr:hypothetical protein OG254_38135 [Streptomyces sp. NBC_01092]